MHRHHRAPVALCLALQTACAGIAVPQPAPQTWQAGMDEHAELGVGTAVSVASQELETAVAEAIAEPVAEGPALDGRGAFRTPSDPERVAELASAVVDDMPYVIRLVDVHGQIPLSLSVHRDGRLPEAMQAQAQAFFSCRRTGQSHEMAHGVLKILVALHQKFNGRVIEVVSGYRASPYGVKDSKHFHGNAIDLRVRGVKTSRVRDFIWRHFANVGVGYYGHQNFIHVDYRPEERDTAWTSPEENAPYSYNPHWALRIRAPWREPREFKTPGTDLLAAAP